MCIIWIYVCVLKDVCVGKCVDCCCSLYYLPAWTERSRVCWRQHLCGITTNLELTLHAHIHTLKHPHSYTLSFLLSHQNDSCKYREDVIDESSSSLASALSTQVLCRLFISLIWRSKPQRCFCLVTYQLTWGHWYTVSHLCSSYSGETDIHALYLWYTYSTTVCSGHWVTQQHKLTWLLENM